MFPKVQAFVQAIQARAGWLEYLAPFIPILAEMLAKILQDCATTEDQAVGLLTAPTDAQLDYVHARLMRRMWLNPQTRRLSKAERAAMAWDVVWGAVAEAQQNPDSIAEAYTQVNATAA